MLAGRRNYWMKVGAIALLSFFGILLLTGFVLEFFPHGKSSLQFDEGTTPPNVSDLSERPQKLVAITLERSVG